VRRDTQQRSAIHKALTDAGRPLSVEELLKLARNEFAGLGIATVYRNLKTLQLQGHIAQVDLPGQPPRWEVSPEHHHHHFLCRICNRMFEIPDCPKDIKQLVPHGFVLEEHDILLIGQCDICAGKNKSRGTAGALRATQRKHKPSKGG
jgi:Fur family ferric uptake transcriptional regulator